MCEKSATCRTRISLVIPLFIPSLFWDYFICYLISSTTQALFIHILTTLILSSSCVLMQSLSSQANSIFKTNTTFFIIKKEEEQAVGVDMRTRHLPELVYETVPVNKMQAANDAQTTAKETHAQWASCCCPTYTTQKIRRGRQTVGK